MVTLAPETKAKVESSTVPSVPRLKGTECLAGWMLPMVRLLATIRRRGGLFKYNTVYYSVLVDMTAHRKAG